MAFLVAYRVQGWCPRSAELGEGVNVLGLTGEHQAVAAAGECVVDVVADLRVAIAIGHETVEEHPR